MSASLSSKVFGFSLLGSLLSALFPGVVHAQTITWTDWTSGTAGTNGVAAGTLTSGGQTANVSYAGEIAFIQTGAGINFWNPSAPYLSATVLNAPPANDIIALQATGRKTLTFASPVRNPIMAVVSLNGNGYAFDGDFQILNFAAGYWGNGTLTRSTPSPGVFQLNGTGEPHGIIEFQGVYTSISWTSLTNENWNGFTIGIRGFACEAHRGTPDANASPNAVCPTAGLPVCSLTGFCVPPVANGEPIPANPRGAPPYDGTCRTADAALVCDSGVCSSADNKCGLENGATALGPNGMPTMNATVCRSSFIAADGKCGQPNSDPVTGTTNACVEPNPVPAVVPQCRSNVCFSTNGVTNAADNQCGKPNNESCTSNSDCRTTCVGADATCGLLNGTPCTNLAECRSRVCNADGKCGDPNGATCATGATCRSGACVAAVCASSCASDSDCAPAAYCEGTSRSCVRDEINDQKTGPIGNKNTNCDRAGQCQSGVCNADGRCGDPDGATCAAANTCRSGQCTALKCGNGCMADTECGTGRYCEDSSRVCITSEPNGSQVGPVALKNTACVVMRGAAQCQSGVCNSDGRCGDPDGVACTGAATCRSGACDATTSQCGGTCPLGGAAGDIQCARPFFCSGVATDPSGTCTADAANGNKPGGVDCDRPAQCASNICHTDGACGRPDGQPCATGNDCRAGACRGGVCGLTACTADSQCPSDTYCLNPGAMGACTPRKPNSTPCAAGPECLSAFCHPDGMCGAPLGDACGSSILCRSAVCDPAKLTCVTCLVDAQCGGSNSGRVCTAISGTCGDGCRGIGGNGCPTGNVCSSMIATAGTCSPVVSDMCVSDGNCTIDQFCNGDVAPRACAAKRDSGEACVRDRQCTSNVCNDDLTCACVPAACEPPDAGSTSSSGSGPFVSNGVSIEGGGCGMAGGSANGGLLLALGIVALARADRRRRDTRAA